MKKIITQSAAETIRLGQKLARSLRGGEVLALEGNLGAGKTTLIKGIARGLGIKKIITSPTFILMNVYKLKTQNSKLKTFVHIDCYRIHKPEDIINIGALECFNSPDAVVVIEWADKIKSILPKKCIKIIFKILRDNKRECVILRLPLVRH